MNKTLLLFLAFELLVISASAQPPSLKKGDRPVYVSVEALVNACKDWESINPGGHRPKPDDVLNVSSEQIAHALACEYYILGYEDGRFNFFGSHYHPAPSHPDYMKSLVDTFLKYAKDHPEKQDFAATTALEEVEKTITKAQTGH